MVTGDAVTRATHRVLAWLAEPHPPAAEDRWADAAVAGTPLVSPSPAGRHRRQVTFLWRATEPLAAVYLSLNRITDKDRFRHGLMTPVAGTDIWAHTLDLAADLRASYAFCPVPVGQDSDPLLASLGGRFPALPFLVDPLNRTAAVATGRNGTASVVALDLAPPQHEWERAAAGSTDTGLTIRGLAGTGLAGTVSARLSRGPIAGRRRRLWTYLPPTDPPEPVGVLVLFDGDVWSALDAPAALDAAITSRRIPPFAVVGVENTDIPDRIRTLGPDPGVLRELAAECVERTRAGNPGIRWAGRERTVLCGQSLGGLAALAAALDAPEVFGAVLAHSPSMWWRPGGGITPAGLPPVADSWITRRFARADPTDVRIRCDTGRLETATVPHVQHLHECLRKRGWRSELALYMGGHDFACWRGALIEGLSTMV